MKFKLNSLISLLLLSIFLIGGARLYYHLTDDFRLSNISHPMAFHSEWEIPPLSHEDQNQLQTLLNQKFSYFDKGSQAYVFLGEDKRTILKFFKFKHLRPAWYIKFLPKAKRREIRIQKKQLLENLFNSYHLGFDLVKQESGLIYIHLNANDGFTKKVEMIDKAGFHRIIDLGHYAFIVQKRATTTRAILTDLLNQQKVVEAKDHIRKIIDLYVSEYQKGIYDKDHGLKTNTGFIGNEAVRLDMGKLRKDSRMIQPAFFKKDLTAVLVKFSKWLKKEFPDSSQEIILDIQLKLYEMWGEKIALPT